ncbi:MAG: PilZ domain-containing protein [Candidatus Omnitrophica bacterium]|nr:PilZ domain-containing protein [Candidatus Omnitrophota bacterium]MBU4487950.1 PilZ domain-containing protein [Candidatus Omnitrophota bacterium]MCG2705071.1 PilZ domain-containing protein [Candidatus Omnitrophota bacterium]
MNYKRDDRRKFIRFNFDANVKFRFFDPIDENIKGKAKNLSAEGLCIVTDKEIPRDKDVELDIYLPGRKKPARIHGSVIWTHKIKNLGKKTGTRFEAGIKLYNIDKDDENSLLRYYCERMTDNLIKYIHL